MVIRNEQQALCVAMEMEKRAIRVYERALMICRDEKVIAGIKDILADEKEHLRRFTEMRNACPMDQSEERMLVQAVAAEMLFPGGVMELERAKGLSTIEGLYAYAAESEKTAVENYLAFAKKCENPAIAEAFMSIAREESTHQNDLRHKLENVRA